MEIAQGLDGVSRACYPATSGASPQLHAASVSGPYLTANLVGFAVGLAIGALLLGLVLRSARLPGTPLANLLFAVCAVLWNAGGLAHSLAVAFGVGTERWPVAVASAAQFTGVALWPASLLAIWHPLAVEGWRRTLHRALLAEAVIAGGAAAVALWSMALGAAARAPFDLVKDATAYNGALLLAVSAPLLLKQSLTSRAARSSALLLMVGVFGSTAALLAHRALELGPDGDAALSVAAKQSVLLIVLGAFILLARFRFADLFIHQSLRIIVGAFFATVLVVAIEGSRYVGLTLPDAFAGATSVFGASVVAVGFLIGFAALDRRLAALVNRWVVGAPDYKAAARQLGEALRCLHDEDGMRRAVEDSVRSTLGVGGVQVIGLSSVRGSPWPAELQDGTTLELSKTGELGRRLPLPDTDLIAPVRVAGSVDAVVAVAVGPGAGGLVSQEVQYVREAAARLGSRLDLLGLERQMAERQQQEAVLREQLTEAELRALRAQVNPHFLFNSLNTIADLIVTNPSGAEAMTLRLAKVFRHVLSRSSRPLTPMSEEIEFLRAYLEIEEARFVGRLQVEIDVPEDVASLSIPSLILQPVVENALKHGLAPKPGPGHLRIAARADTDWVRLTVEDDGLGPGGPRPGPAAGKPPGGDEPRHSGKSTGVGLSNVGRRMAALYRDSASVRLERRESGGTCVTIVMPRAEPSGAS
jgi:two-component system LytT family sensor kinase